MNKEILFLTLAIAVVGMMGCEGAKVPLGDLESSGIDEELVGHWDVVNLPEGENATHLIIIAFNEHEYYVETWEGGENADTLRLNMFMTPVDGLVFANVRCIGCDDDDEYFFFSYDVDESGVLSIQGVSDSEYNQVMKEIESSKALREYFLENMQSPDFFDDEVIRFKRTRY